MTEQNAMTDEMILVPRAELIAWAKAWLFDYGPNDGTDCVTPFDWHLLKTPVETQPVGVEELVERMRQAPDRLWMADLVGQKISVERMRDILTFALAQQPAADFDTWQQNPYTKVLMKSIDEDYVPKHVQQPAAVDDGLNAVVRVVADKLAADRSYGRWQAVEDLREALAEQPAADGGFTAADMMDARQEGRKEAQQPAAVGEEVKVLARDEHLVLIARALGDALSAHAQLEDEAGWSPLDLAQLRKAAQAVYEMGGEP